MSAKIAPETALRRAETKLRKATAILRRDVSDLARILNAACEGWQHRGSDTWGYDPTVLTVTELRIIEAELDEILETAGGLDRLDATLICRAISEIGAGRIVSVRFDLRFPRTGLQSSVPLFLAAYESAVEVLHLLADVGVRRRDVRCLDALQAA